MKASLLFSLTCAGLSAAHALDLTPIHSFRVMEKVKIPVVMFVDDKLNVQWQPPGGWQLSGGDSQLNLYPPNKPLSAMLLKVISREAAEVPDPTAAPEDLLKWALAFLPGDTSSLIFDRESPNPFILDKPGVRELNFSYVSAARKCNTSIALANINETQALVVVITAPEQDFQEIHGQGTGSMYRWNYVPKAPIVESVAASAPAKEAAKISVNTPTKGR